MTRAHGVEITIPTRPPQASGFLDGKCFRGKRLQREIYRISLRCQLIPPHDLGASIVVDLDVCA